MIPLHRVAGLVYNRPLLITPQAALTISNVLQSHIEGRAAGVDVEAGHREDRAPRASSFVGEELAGENGGPGTPFRVTKNGTAIIPIVGELVNRGAWLAVAAKDSRVKAILLDIESPGGEAVGAFDAAAAVRRAASIKPVTAFANGLMASGAYALGSGATRRVTIPEGISGSIGVVAMHLDISAALHNRGLKPTLIFAGAHKVDGNPFEPLPADVRAQFQQEVEKFYDQFVTTVASGTKLSETAIRDTEARTYIGEDARRVGLVDEVGTFDDVLAKIEKPSTTFIVSPQPAAILQRKGGTMDPTTNIPATPGTPDVAAQLATERARSAELQTKYDAERQARELAEKGRLKTDANAKVDSWEKEGKLSGNGTAAAREFYVALACGEAVTPAGFEKVIAAMPKFDTSRIAADGLPQKPVLNVSKEDVDKAATNAEAAKRVSAEIAQRQKENPKFTIHDLRRELAAK